MPPRHSKPRHSPLEARDIVRLLHWRFGIRRDETFVTVPERTELHIPGIEVTALETGTDDRGVPGLLPDLLQFRRINVQDSAISLMDKEWRNEVQPLGDSVH